MRPANELMKPPMNAFSVSAATSASELRNMASTCAMMPSTSSGRSARSQIMPTFFIPPAWLHGLLEVLAVEPEDHGAAGLHLRRDDADDLEGQIDGEERAAQRDVLADAPAELLHGVLADQRGVADRLEAGERARVDVVVGPDVGDRLGVDREVGEHVLRLVVDPAEPRVLVDRDDARDRLHALRGTTTAASR